MQLTAFSTEQTTKFARMNETQISMEIVKRLEEKSELQKFVPQNLTIHGDIQRLEQEAEALLIILKTVKSITSR